jgi:hypothetical protein
MGIRNALAIALIAVFGIVGAWVGWFALQAYVLDACERFGCAGGFTFAFTFSAEGGIVAAIAAVAAGGILTFLRAGRVPAGVSVRTLIAALLLAPLLRTLPKWPVPDSLLLPAWFAVCLLVFLVLLGARRSGR